MISDAASFCICGVRVSDAFRNFGVGPAASGERQVVEGVDVLIAIALVVRPGWRQATPRAMAGLLLYVSEPLGRSIDHTCARSCGAHGQPPLRGMPLADPSRESLVVQRWLGLSEQPCG